MTFVTTSAFPARDCRRVTLKIKGIASNEETEITAVEMPDICFDSFQPPAISDPVITDFAKNFYLADMDCRNHDFDGIILLTGADNYWKLVTGETKK